MDWPLTPVHRSRWFRPRHCPWPDCPEHRRREPGYRFRQHADYSTSRRPTVARFFCLCCHRSFSQQTFSLTYYLKRPELLERIAAGLAAGSAHRQLARSLGCAASTVTRLSARLGRHGLLLQARSLRALEGRLGEPVVVDHFETFEFSQDLPFGVATPVGSASWFVYGLDPAPHGRAGAMTEAQKERLRRRPHRQRRGGYEGSFSRTIDFLRRLSPPCYDLEIVCDGHESYERAFSNHPDRDRIRLRVFPNVPRGPKGSPRTEAAIERDRAMFASDVLHGLLRHTAAHHRRETIAFGRRLNALMERLFLLATWRNFIKARSERKPDPTTPAMRLDLTDRPWTWARLLGRRLFPGREKLPEVWMELYRRAWPTPVLAHNARHELRHAY